MNTTLKNWIELSAVRWRLAVDRWRRSLLRRLMWAWMRELHGMLPARVQQTLASRSKHQIAVWPALENLDPRRPVHLRLPPDHVIVEQLKLPIAATRNLSKVLSFEIDRYTPFSLDQVQYGARITGQHGEQAAVLLVAISNDRLNEIAEECQVKGFALGSIRALDPSGAVLDVDLLPHEQRPRLSSHQAMHLALIPLAGLLIVALLAMSLHKHSVKVERMQQEVAKQRLRVKELNKARQELINTQGAATYLARLRIAQPPVTHLLAELTTCLGDDTWLEQLELTASGELTLSGQSPRSSELISRARTCRQLSQVEFRGVIQPDAKTGHDRFSLSAKIKTGVDNASINERT